MGSRRKVLRETLNNLPIPPKIWILVLNLQKIWPVVMRMTLCPLFFGGLVHEITFCSVRMKIDSNIHPVKGCLHMFCTSIYIYIIYISIYISTFLIELLDRNYGIYLSGCKKGTICVSLPLPELTFSSSVFK